MPVGKAADRAPSTVGARLLSGVYDRVGRLEAELRQFRDRLAPYAHSDEVGRAEPRSPSFANR
jgi:hypothetical protein